MATPSTAQEYAESRLQIYQECQAMPGNTTDLDFTTASFEDLESAFKKGLALAGCVWATDIFDLPSSTKKLSLKNLFAAEQFQSEKYLLGFVEHAAPKWSESMQTSLEEAEQYLQYQIFDTMYAKSKNPILQHLALRKLDPIIEAALESQSPWLPQHYKISGKIAPTRLEVTGLFDDRFKRAFWDFERRTILRTMYSRNAHSYIKTPGYPDTLLSELDRPTLMWLQFIASEMAEIVKTWARTHTEDLKSLPYRPILSEIKTALNNIEDDLLSNELALQASCYSQPNSIYLSDTSRRPSDASASSASASSASPTGTEEEEEESMFLLEL